MKADDQKRISDILAGLQPGVPLPAAIKEAIHVRVGKLSENPPSTQKPTKSGEVSVAEPPTTSTNDLRVMMRKLYRWDTTEGPFYIAHHEGRFCIIFDSENLGSYVTAEQAADDLAGGHQYGIRNGLDTSTLGISANLADWQRLVT